MELRLGNNVEEFKYEVGDAIVLSTGDVFILCYDYDESDYRAFDLKTLVATGWYNNITVMVNDIEHSCCGNVIRVIKADSLYMGEK